jgi:putative hydrolase of the HAD superfamily
MNLRQRPTALLIDFDGVLRHHDAAVYAAVESGAGLDPGTVLTAASDPALLIPALLGRVSRSGWRTDIAAALADRLGGLDEAERLVAEWDSYRGEIVPEVRDAISALRASGVPVALCTNGTDDLAEDLELFQLSNAFDAVVSSVDVGAVKPMREFYLAACAAVDTEPAYCLFVDDTARNVAGARAAGLLGYRYTGPDDVGYLSQAFQPTDR